ncbi:MAG TPA: amino acid racemase [Candidatus Saccharimonadales bacterium]|nr:amino acid racemase [Candidatus Saccharimonadales bacterium]
MRKPIVILGGMGPQASIRFQQLLIEKSMAFHSGDNDQFPYIVHLSIPVTDFISGESARHAAAQTLNQLAPLVKALHPGQVALACNTAHLLATEVEMLQQPPFVSMLEVVAQKIQQDNRKTIGLMASPTTIRTRLYTNILAGLGVRVLEPTAAQQAALEAAIRAVIARTAGQQEQATLTAVGQSLAARGAEALLLGCTELPLLFNMADALVPTYDCLDMYAEELIGTEYSQLAH